MVKVSSGEVEVEVVTEAELESKLFIVVSDGGCLEVAEGGEEEFWALRGEASLEVCEENSRWFLSSSCSIRARSSLMYSIVPYSENSLIRTIQEKRRRPRELTCRISSLCNPPRSPDSSPLPRFLPLSLAFAIFFAPSSLSVGTVSFNFERQSFIFSLLLLSINECETFRFEAPPPTASLDDLMVEEPFVLDTGGG